jgi:dolichol-phosphate mannosyltransferase
MHPFVNRLWLWRNRRFVRFGAVGSLGLVVNLSFLSFFQEVALTFILSPTLRLNLSLGCAIVLSTIHHFAWNRVWTWADRQKRIGKALCLQLVQYFAACVFSIAIQFALTSFLAPFIHYLVANILAVVFASAINYLLNDKWTFGGGRVYLHLRQRL